MKVHLRTAVVVRHFGTLLTLAIAAASGYVAARSADGERDQRQTVIRRICSAAGAPSSAEMTIADDVACAARVAALVQHFREKHHG